MASHAQDERHALADLLDELGPSAPTLCAGWTTADLAAHLVLRERRPDAAAGVVVPLLAGYTARVQRQVRDGRPWTDLVEAVRSGPPLPLRPFDETINVVEFFVHHEDVRRGSPGWAPRVLDAGLATALWTRLRLSAPLLLRRAGVGVELVAPERSPLRGGGRAPTVRVEGQPGEILLFLFGRSGHADVNLEGDT